MLKHRNYGVPRAFECNLKGAEHWSTVHALDAGKARYLYFLHIRECCPDAKITDIHVRSCGRRPPAEPLGFRDVAERRGVPFARIGMRVEVDGKMGVISKHNDSSNFDVAFDDGSYGNCHPHWKMRYFDTDGKEILPTS